MESKLMFDVKTLRISLQAGAKCLEDINRCEGLTKYAKGRLDHMNEIIDKLLKIEEANKE